MTVLRLISVWRLTRSKGVTGLHCLDRCHTWLWEWGRRQLTARRGFTGLGTPERHNMTTGHEGLLNSEQDVGRIYTFEGTLMRGDRPVESFQSSLLAFISELGLGWGGVAWKEVGEAVNAATA